MYDMIRAIVRQEIEFVTRSRKHSRNAVVTSVDGDSYSVKTRYEPHDPSDADGAEGGWVPIQAAATGQGYGVYFMPEVGHPVEAQFQEGDHETGRVVQRHASEAHQPPTGMKESEYWFVHKTGSALKFLKDGTISLLGAGSIPNRQGKDASTGKDGQSQQNKQPEGKQTFTVSPDGSFSFTHKGGTTISVDKSGAVTIKAKDQSVTLDAGQGSVTYKAKSHSFQGDANIDGGLSTSGNVTSSGTVQGAIVTNGTKAL